MGDRPDELIDAVADAIRVFLDAAPQSDEEQIFQPWRFGECPKSDLAGPPALQQAAGGISFPKKHRGTRMKLLILAAALVSSTIATSAIAQSNLIILTGSTSGVYYPLGSALSSIYMKSIPGIRTTVQVTQGSVENLRLLHAGDGEAPFSLGDTVSAAWKGNPEAGFPAPLSHLRGVAAIYSNHVQIVASETSAAKALTDLKGKRVSVGPKQSGTELNAGDICSGRHTLRGLRANRLSAFRAVGQNDRAGRT